ncbi:MAG: hypothetical protein IH919_05735 [Deltaproteobacteria bacterium]|nr:hypothetical protein [Deltaproteobacteria bacterium]
MNGAEFDFRDGPKGFVRVWKKVILDPWEFYREMPSSGGFENPLIFLGISAVFYFLLRIAVSDLVDAVSARLDAGEARIDASGSYTSDEQVLTGRRMAFQFLSASVAQ